MTSQLVTEATFTDDHDTLIAPLWAGAVYEWDTRPAHAIQFACRIAGRDFTSTEWKEQFGSRSFQRTCPPGPQHRRRRMPLG